VIGFHDAPIAAYLDPPLTTVRMPLAEMAEQSVDTLIRIVEGERLESLVIEAPPVLVERASTAPPPRLDIERGG
jgi:DNA-binding LacI/PurR family transcriptional regulator